MMRKREFDRFDGPNMDVVPGYTVEEVASALISAFGWMNREQEIVTLEKEVDRSTQMYEEKRVICEDVLIGYDLC